MKTRENRIWAHDFSLHIDKINLRFTTQTCLTVHVNDYIQVVSIKYIYKFLESILTQNHMPFRFTNHFQ